MTKYREILRLRNLGLSQNDIATSCQVSKKTVNRVLKLAKEHNLNWPLEERLTDKEIGHSTEATARECRATHKKRPARGPLYRGDFSQRLLGVLSGEFRLKSCDFACLFGDLGILLGDDFLVAHAFFFSSGFCGKLDFLFPCHIALLCLFV